MSKGGSDRYRDEPKDIVKKIVDLERRISVLERVPRANSASVDSGQITVKGGDIVVQDIDGVDVIRITQGGGTRPAINFTPLGATTDSMSTIYAEDTVLDGIAQTVGKNEIRTTPGDSAEGGFLHTYQNVVQAGWQSDTSGEKVFFEAGIINSLSGKLRFVGTWLNNFQVLTTDAVYPGSFVATAGFSSWTLTYFSSFASTVYPVIGLLNSSGALSWAITAQSASSFTVAWTGTAAKTINMWNIRL